MTYRAKANFYRQLNTLLKSGFSFLTALKSMRSTGLDPRVYSALSEGISSGKPMTEALSDFSPRIFSKFETAVLSVGEASGTLPNALGKLADYYEFLSRTKSRIISGLIYPAVLLHAAIIIPAVPRLIFKGGGSFLAATLPPLVILYGLFFALVFLRKKISPSSPPGLFFGRILLKTPVVGTLTKKIGVLRFLQSFICLYAAGVGVIEAVQLAAQTIGNPIMEEEMSGAVLLLKSSKTVSEALAGVTFLPPVVQDMLGTGEISGRMDETLERAAGYIQHEVDTAIARLISLLPVIVYLIIAAYVGYVVISFYRGYLGQINSLLE